MMARILSLCVVLFVVWQAAQPARAADAVVGDGTPVSCTEAAFDTALATAQAGGGTITFACGGPVTILFTAQKNITAAVTIDGGGRATLSGGNSTRLFFVSNSGALTLRATTLTNGLGSGDGGAIHSRGSLTLTSTTIRNSNTTSNFSGGAVVSSGPVTIDASLFENNAAGNGGALYLRWEAGDATITGSTFRNNRTTHLSLGWGGAILLWDGADLVVQTSDFDGNQARTGGTIHNLFANSSVELAQGTTLRNSVALNGGGIYNERGDATLTDVTLSGNAATESGGGLYNTLGATTLTDVTLSGNSARLGGGMNNHYAVVTLTNVTLSGNSASNGGGIRNFDSIVALTHVTLSGNSATAGGGISHYGLAVRTITLKNVLLAHGDGGASGGNCFVYPQSVASITSAGFNLSSDTSCTGYLTQAGDRNATDPVLGPLANNGGPTWTHMLLAGSPAIDAGQCVAGLSTDQRGMPRLQGPACDIGAVERQPNDGMFFVYLPATLR